MDLEKKQDMVMEFNFKARKNDGHVEIASHRPDYRNPRKVVFMINWGAIGSVDTKKTKHFINWLQKAVTLCNKLNK